MCIMFNKNYTNFVKASSSDVCPGDYKNIEAVLSGEEARRLYLEEINNARPHSRPTTSTLEKRKIVENEEIALKNKDLYEIVQNNEVIKLKCVLDKYPDKLNIVDDYGWSLLMIACQANSVESAEELLRRKIDISVRDKAGNSARSLVIKNKSYALVDLLLNYKDIDCQHPLIPENITNKKDEEYFCHMCNKTFPNRKEHLSSTIHNLSTSKGKKIPVNYVLPSSNKGYQLMLKGGWHKDSGLGRDGSGIKYPIKTVQKTDRKGLGHEKRKQEHKQSHDGVKFKSKRDYEYNYKNNKQFEINFRREFY